MASKYPLALRLWLLGPFHCFPDFVKGGAPNCEMSCQSYFCSSIYQKLNLFVIQINSIPQSSPVTTPKKKLSVVSSVTCWTCPELHYLEMASFVTFPTNSTLSWTRLQTVQFSSTTLTLLSF